MPTITAGPAGLNMIDQIAIGFVPVSFIASESSVSFTFVDTNNNRQTFNGAFVYDQVGNVLGGTINSVFNYNPAGSLVYALQGIAVSIDQYSTFAAANNLNGFFAQVLGGADSLNGDAARDFLAGFAGNDTMLGAGGNDTLSGGLGDDILDGQAGDDVVLGDAGNDLVTGGTGADILFGGAGADTFVFRSGSGLDGIFDFNRAEGDKIAIETNINGAGVTTAALQAAFQIDQGGSSFLYLGNAGGQDQWIAVVGVAHVDASDIVLI